MTRVVPVSLAVCLISVLVSQAVPADQSTTAGPPTSVTAVKAQQQYAAAIKAAKTAFGTQVAEAKKACASDLDQALKQAMAAGNLDEANRINAAKRQLDEVPAEPPATSNGAVADGVAKAGGADLRNGGSVSLLRLPVSFARVGWDGFGAGMDDSGKPFKRPLAGRDTTDYLFAHANSLLIYDVPAGAKRFTATGTTGGGNDERTTHYRFVVSADDGKVLASTRELSTYPNWSVPIEAVIPENCKRVRLETISDSPHGMQWSVWTYPRFSGGPVGRAGQP